MSQCCRGNSTSSSWCLVQSKAKLTDWCGQRRWTVCDDDDSNDMVGGDDDDDDENGDHGVFDDDVQSIISMMM